MIYDQRNPSSPYFAQPIGPARGGLYFETALIEDLPSFTETRPRAISDQFSKMLFDRMNRLGALSPGARVPNYVLPGQYAQSGHSRTGTPTQQGQPLQQQQKGPASQQQQQIPQKQHLPPPPQMMRRDSSRSAGSSLPPTLPPIGESVSHPDLAHAAGEQGRNGGEAGQVPGAGQHGHSRTASQDRELPPKPDDSFSSSFEQAVSQNENRKLPTQPVDSSAPTSRPDSPSRAHPAILRPGSTDSSAQQHQRKPSLDAIHSGAHRQDRGGHAHEDDEGLSRLGEAMYLSQGPALQHGHQQQDTQQPAPGVSYDSVSTALSTSPAGSTAEGHYNAFPVRSTTPSGLSATSASARAAAATPGVPMPGQYIPTPSLDSDAVPGVSGDSAPAQAVSEPGNKSATGPLPYHQHLSQSQQHQQQAVQPGLSLPGQPLQQHLRPLSPPGGTQASFYTANTASSRAGSTAPSSVHQREASPTPPVPAMPTASAARGDDHNLSDSPGALYALMNDDSREEDDVDLHRSVSQAQPVRSYQQQPQSLQTQYQRELANAIRQRAEGSRAHQQQPTELRTGTNTTTANTPISALATSASEYSGTGTAFTPFREYTQEGLPSGSAQGMASAPLPPSKGADFARSLSAEIPVGQGQEQPTGQREHKVSSASTAEGQDDFLAAANFLALTADQEPPPMPPGSSPRQKPVISIQTGKSASPNAPQPPSIVEHTPSTANSPVDPLSPDPYGTYTEPATSQRPTMHVVDNSPPLRGKSGGSRSSFNRAEEQVQNASSSSRKPGRRGVPVIKKSGKKLGSWSSDEDDEDQEKDSDVDSDGGDGSKAGATSPPLQIHSPPADGNQQRRQSTASSGGGSARRNLPELPGPSTDPYINQNASPSMVNFQPHHQQRQSMQYQEDPQYAQYAQQQVRNSMFGWPGQQGMMQPWQQQQHQTMMMGGYMPPYGHPQHHQSGSGSGPNTPLAHSPSGSFSGQQGSMPPTNIISQIADRDGGAEGRAARNAAMAPHGLLQAALQEKQSKSAAAQEANAKETGGPFLQISAKPQGPQGGLVGAIAAHERDRKREGGLGATLTERERERRSAEQKQREMDQMHARNASFGGMPFGGPAFPGFGAMPNGMAGFGGQQGYSMDPAQMQQRKCLLRLRYVPYKLTVTSSRPQKWQC